MDPMVLRRLANAWREEFVGATFSGVAGAAGGVELVFDRPPEGARPGRRAALFVRLEPPVWAWTGPASPRAEWVHRPAPGQAIVALDADGADRRLMIALEGGARIELELWPQGNVVVVTPEGRVAWCAIARRASSFRGAVAVGLPFAPAPAGLLLDPVGTTGAALAGRAGSTTREGSLLLRLTRDVAGLPRGLLAALVPTMPRALVDHAPHDPEGWTAFAAELARWVAATYDATAPTVRAYTWRLPSPGVTLVTRTLEPSAGAAEGVAYAGSFDSWTAAARGVAEALPKPLDHAAIAEAKQRLRRLERAERAVLADLEEARGAADVRAQAVALAAFLPRVERGVEKATLPDPADPARSLTIPLDPKLRPHENADRLFRRAGKLERVAEQAPARLSTVRAELERTRREVESLERGEEPAARAPRLRAGTGRSTAATTGRRHDEIPAALVPRRFRTKEGWEVLVGRNNQGNDHLTHRMARSEDYWLHVHGAAGSHVVLRRGKGANEPSKATLEEVAAWAAFYSQARTAGTVPVTVTQKKYVTKPRRSPAGLAHVTRSKTVFARPAEPPAEARVEADGGAEGTAP